MFSIIDISFCLRLSPFYNIIIILFKAKVKYFSWVEEKFLEKL
nr:MAG TPA: hypothetical protein [Caudoviricetes sp.]